MHSASDRLIRWSFSTISSQVGTAPPNCQRKEDLISIFVRWMGNRRCQIAHALMETVPAEFGQLRRQKFRNSYEGELREFPSSRSKYFQRSESAHGTLLSYVNSRDRRQDVFHIRRSSKSTRSLRFASIRQIGPRLRLCGIGTDYRQEPISGWTVEACSCASRFGN